MGNVVDLDSAQRRPSRRRRSKTALVLGGGGFTGAVYQIGALRALDLLFTNRSVNSFDVNVGTSAGAVIAALTANGIPPAEMMRVLNHQEEERAYPDMDLGMLLRPNYAEMLRRGIRMPFHALRALGSLGWRPTTTSSVDIALGLADALPSGIYTGAGVERYMRKVLSMEGFTDDFRELQCELYLAATDLDTCERVVLGAEGWDDVPISGAVRASAALPLVYDPHRLKGRELVDGGIVSTTNLDIAVEAGARLIVVVNPLVPFVNDFSRTVPTLFGRRARRVSDMGFAKIGYQTFKLIAYQRLHEMARQWEERYPGVDIVLIEPEPDDELMFETNVMNFASRIEVARHGFRSVTVKLAEDYEHLRETCHRHGIEISSERVETVVGHFEAEPERTGGWRRILEQTTSVLLRQSGEDELPPSASALR